MMNKRNRRSFTDEFKEQIVKLYQTGKKVVNLSKDYELSEQQIYRWIREYEDSGSFKAADNRSDEENELIRLRKENQQLKMENDILKQAALIMGRKSNS
ncbi:MAG: transposase [Erysipelothrix sp.]|nr:transposase [Erysipelothrix sp.]